MLSRGVKYTFLIGGNVWGFVAVGWNGMTQDLRGCVCSCVCIKPLEDIVVGFSHSSPSGVCMGVS